MKTVTSKRCNTHTLHHNAKGIIPKIMCNNHISHYDDTKKNDTEQKFYITVALWFWFVKRSLRTRDQAVR